MTDFGDRIMRWYRTSRRDLPWRHTRDPYTIWVSEVILQQTKVDQGLGYFLRFTGRFPDVQSLASASGQEVLAVWKGLGYYSRARNMHAAAGMVVSEYQGVFPETYDKLIKLKGIGKYTAAAVASISGGEPVPVVDGNVIRVFSRLFGIEEVAGSGRSFKRVAEKSLQYIHREDPGTYNQAVMEFGALFCKPGRPDCPNCIFSDECFAFLNGKVEQLPVKRPEIPRKTRWFNYIFAVTAQGDVVMQQRRDRDIWENLWELPLVESGHLLDPGELEASGLWKQLDPYNACKAVLLSDAKHILSHRIIYARFYKISGILNMHLQSGSNYKLIPVDQLKYLPVSRLMDRFFQDQVY
jgi:A/G-specific adenine glycosylase